MDDWEAFEDYPIPNYPDYGSCTKTSIFTILKYYGEYEVHISVHKKENNKFDVVSCAEHRCTDPSTNVESKDIDKTEIESKIKNCCGEWDKHFSS